MSPTHSGSLEEFIPASQTELSRFMTENATTDQKQISRLVAGPLYRYVVLPANPEPRFVHRN